MRKLLLAAILLVILLSLINQVRDIAQGGNSVLSDLYQKTIGAVSGWVEQATEKGKELKDKWNTKVKEATEKYQNLKQDFDDLTKKIQDKKLELEKSIQELNEAKKALDDLLTSPDPSPEKGLRSPQQQ